MYKDNKMPLATVVGSIEANSNPSGFWACLIPQRYAPLYYLCLHKNAPSVITLKYVFFVVVFFAYPIQGWAGASTGCQFVSGIRSHSHLHLI